MGKPPADKPGVRYQGCRSAARSAAFGEPPRYMLHPLLNVNGCGCMPSDNQLLEAALQYAGRGWRILPLHGIVPDSPSEYESGTITLRCTCPKGSACKTPGKHPRIKTGRRYAAASTDPATIARWWARWPDSNVGLATGIPPGAPPGALGLALVDIDAAKGLETLQAAMVANGAASIPRTLQASTGRPGGGIHLYYLSDDCPQGSGDGLDCRGAGGLVVAPPSRHISGATYTWADPLAVLERMPAWLTAWFRNRPRLARPEGSRKGGFNQSDSLSTVPEHLRTRKSAPIARQLRTSLRGTVPVSDIAAALEVIPNEELGWDEWNRIGMAAYASNPESFDAFELWSKKSKKFQEGACAERWHAYAGCPPQDLSFGTLYHLAKEAVPGWEPPSHQVHAASSMAVDGPLSLPVDREPEAQHPERNGHTLNGHQLPSELTRAIPSNPLIELNNKYAVIGDVGGKCMVLGWVPSKVDPTIKVPSFQAFAAFEQRYASQYLMVNDEPKPLGKKWLHWTGRRSFEGIDLEPNGPEVLPGPVLNLWSGFAVQPAKGSWSAMRDHIAGILASGDAACADYIFRYAAWTVQHPGERAEVALVFRGGKGSGKGTFANAMKRIFGHHGLQIFNSKHLVGSFNGHLRNCLLLFADEAFWAGDKQGESVLKGMLTEPALMIEQKGIDASPWRNRLHVIMAANADWVIPASHDERRYAMFDADDSRIGNRAYFQKINTELASGGLAAMLHDLLHVPLGDWHPRQVLHTAALQAQKARSLDAKHEWLESLLQAGELPIANTPNGDYICQSYALLNMVRDAGGKLSREITANAMGRFLKTWECVHVHRVQGSAWRFPSLLELRDLWEKKFGKWKWDIPLEKWNERG